MAGRGNIVRTFDSLAAFVDYARAVEAPSSSHAISDMRTDFTGTKDFAEASTLAHGWTEGAARIERLRAQITPRGQKSRRKSVMREVGPGSLSMGNYLAGHPQPYVAIEETNAKRPGKGKVVRLLVNITVSSLISTDVIEQRGAAVVALADALERAGRRVEITGCMAVKTRRGGRTWEARFTLKQASQKVNIPSLAFALAHPSMLRRMVFAAMERENATDRQAFEVGGRYGTPTETLMDEDPHRVYVGCMLWGAGPFGTVEDATGWVIDSLKAQGVRLK